MKSALLCLLLSLIGATTNKIVGVCPEYFSDVSTEELSNVQEKLQYYDWHLIYPGTLWCGDGDIANSTDDLGTEVEADRCCRTHDFCTDIIESHQTKNGLYNAGMFTKLNCACDCEFRACLKRANTYASNIIGNIFFTMYNTECFKEEYPAVICTKKNYFPYIKCIEYNVDDSQKPVYQWFKVPNY